MFSNYFIYLFNLPAEQAIKQFFLIIFFLTTTLSFYIILLLLKEKFYNPEKNTIFQKFLKKV